VTPSGPVAPDGTSALPDPPVALSIAGTDTGGGAGIAADLKTFAAHGVHGTFVVTAMTAQDTRKVHGVVVSDHWFVALQLDAVLGDFTVRAAKTGMLATADLVNLVAERAEAGELPRLVVDPVMVASSGASLVEGDAPAAYRRLLASATIVTPNLPEAEALLDRPVRGLGAMIEAARALQGLGAGLVVVKGGHLPGDDACDVVYDGDHLEVLHRTRVPTANVHGTGCTLSAAIAANLAIGLTPLQAVVAAKDYVTGALRRSATWHLASGPGPLDHLGRLPGPGGPRGHREEGT